MLRLAAAFARPRGVPIAVYGAWSFLEDANLRALGHAAMGVYVIVIVVTGGATLASVSMAVLAIALRERFWLLALAALIANVALLDLFNFL